MDVMFVLLVATVAVVSVFAFIGAVLFVVGALGGSKKHRARRRALLSDGLQRLKSVSTVLLERVNDIDQHLKYQDQSAESETSKTRIVVVAGDLVKVAETIPIIEQLISEKRFDDAADLLSASCRLIDKVVRIVTQLESAMPGIKVKADKGATIDLGARNSVHIKESE